MIRRMAIMSAALVCATPALAADPNAGKNLFRQQCALCHSAEPGDNGGAQGPNLNGVLGRPAASDPHFGYTKAMKNSHLTWDAATLSRFLSSPTTVVPGSAMVVAVPKETDRANLIAYFQGVKEGTFKASPPPQFSPPPGQANAGPPKGAPDWKNDKPGRVHRIDVNNLPPAFASPSATNFPKLVDRPADAHLQVPAGFKVDVFARDLEGARAMRLAPNGDIFLTETRGGFVKVLRPSADGATAASVTTFAQGLDLPFGIAFYPARDPKWLYVAETNRVVRYAYKVGDQKASGLPEIVIPELSPVGTGGHFTRDIAFSLDGKRMFVSVGSASNVAEDMPKKTPQEIQSWEAKNGLGAAWGPEEKRADVLVYDLGSSKPGKGKIFATGIRNCAGLTIQPVTGDLWCTTNERDLLGDDLVPDYSTRVREGHFYGWPWYYMGNHEDPRLKGDRPDLAGKVTVPDVPYQAHSAALNLVFYTATSGSSAFPKEYVGDGFAVMHGSWNRAFRTGHKIVRVRMKDGVPTGEYDDFLVGFIADDGDAWARPVGAVVARDGSLLMSDDGNNMIYRISYTAAATAALPETITIPGERIFPESLTSASDGSVIIGSIGQKAIYRAKPGASSAEVWIPAGKDGLNSVFGVFADNKTNTLYACSNSFGPPGAAPSVNATLYAFDLNSGASKAHYVFPTEKAACNDIAVDGAGNIYATDTNNMEIVRLKKGGTALEVWAGNGAFGPKGGVLDGISVLGQRVFANTLATSKLFSVPIESSGKAGAVVEVKLDREISRPDGMRSFGKSDLLIVEGGNGGRLSRITLSGDTGKVTTLKEGYPDGPVAVTVVGTTAYVLEGQLAALMRPPGAGGAPPELKPFKATAVQVGKP